MYASTFVILLIATVFGNSSGREIWVTLTTIPGREKYVEKCIESIFKQTIRPDRILINTCKNYKRFDRTLNQTKVAAAIKRFDPFAMQIELEKDFGPSSRMVGLLRMIKNENKRNVTIIEVTTTNPRFS